MGARRRASSNVENVGPLAVGLGLLIVGGLGSMFMKRRTCCAPVPLPPLLSQLLTCETRSPCAGVPFLENALMYGGVGLFSAFVLYDTNKVRGASLLHSCSLVTRVWARHAVQLVDRARVLPVGSFDPASESIGIYLVCGGACVRAIVGGCDAARAGHYQPLRPDRPNSGVEQEQVTSMLYKWSPWVSC